MQDTDCADQLLHAERSHLLSLKRSLEAQLNKVQIQLQQLNKARAQLTASIQERSRVTDLLCQSMTPSSQIQSQPSSTSMRPSSARQTWNSKVHSGHSLRSSRSQSVVSHGCQSSRGRSSATPRKHHSKSLSAPTVSTSATVGSYGLGGTTGAGELKMSIQ